MRITESKFPSCGGVARSDGVVFCCPDCSFFQPSPPLRGPPRPGRGIQARFRKRSTPKPLRYTPERSAWRIREYTIRKIIKTEFFNTSFYRFLLLCIEEKKQPPVWAVFFAIGIMLTLLNRPVQPPAQGGEGLGEVAAFARTTPGTFASRRVRVVEHPTRLCRYCVAICWCEIIHTTPTI